MKILFIHTRIDITSPLFNPTIAILSAIAKQKGHITSLLFYDKLPDVKKINTDLDREQPDLIAWSVTTTQWDYAKIIGRMIENWNPKIPVILGGIHPTIVPEEVITQSWVDMICIGEGEDAFTELLDTLASNKRPQGINNLWIKKSWLGSKLEKNLIAPATADLDNYPVWDIEIFGKNNFAKQNTLSFLGYPGFLPFLGGRGCPYRCTYCCNSQLLNLYKGERGPFFRKRSVNGIIAEMKSWKDSFPSLQGFEFWDELLHPNRHWIKNFCDIYKKEVGLPFTLALRPEAAIKETLTKLKEAGCIMVMTAIECADEEYRRKYLNRKTTNQQILSAYKNARELGIKTLAFNMIGLPFETAKMIKKTIELNRLAQPDIIGFSVFLPLPGTPLQNLCHEKGMLSDRKTLISSDQSVLDNPTLSQEELSSCYKEFQQLADHVATMAVAWKEG